VRALAALAACTLGGCFFSAPPVTRLADGIEYEGRAVSGDAYAAYAKAALLEARGDDQRALAAYDLAASHDPDSPEILARLGAVACRLSRAPGDELGLRADKSFSRALKLDQYSATAWTELCVCANRRGDVAGALAAGLRAVDADASSLRATLLVVALLERQSQLPRARSWLDALVVRQPGSHEAWRALAAFAERHHDLGRALRAEQGLAELGFRPGPRQALTQALARDRVEDSRRAALELRLPAGELALREVRAGRVGAAAAQAELVLGANPDDADAWIAALCAASLERNEAAFLSTLRAAPLDASTPSAAGLELLGELLERRIGPEAKSAWQAAQGRAEAATLRRAP
jgi:Tfp pilus assembly protein PilF